MLANDGLFTVTNNLLFILSKSATIKQKLVTAYVFVAEISGVCSAEAAHEGLVSCVCHNHRVSCPSPGRKPRQQGWRISHSLDAKSRPFKHAPQPYQLYAK